MCCTHSTQLTVVREGDPRDKTYYINYSLATRDYINYELDAMREDRIIPNHAH